VDANLWCRLCSAQIIDKELHEMEAHEREWDDRGIEEREREWPEPARSSWWSSFWAACLAVMGS